MFVLFMKQQTLWVSHCQNQKTKYLQSDSCVPAVILVRTGTAVEETGSDTGEILASCQTQQQKRDRYIDKLIHSSFQKAVTSLIRVNFKCIKLEVALETIVERFLGLCLSFSSLSPSLSFPLFFSLSLSFFLFFVHIRMNSSLVFSTLYNKHIIREKQLYGKFRKNSIGKERNLN